MAFVREIRSLPLSSPLLLLQFLSFILSTFVDIGGAAAAKVPAIYVFGDSTADVGNNNYLPGSAAKANFPHNGIDFPSSRPTGRFSNGYNGIDFLATHMGFRRSPLPFLSLTNKTNHQVMRGLRGVNFASGGSGVLDSTGSTITLSKQIQYFATIQSNITARTSRETAEYVISRSLFLISTGGNDIFAFFSQNNSPTNSQKRRFTATLVSECTNHVKALYTLGARKFGVIDVPPIGCCPYPRSLSPTGDCIDLLNELARRFNRGVGSLMQNLSSTLQGFKYSIGSSHKVVLQIIRYPDAFGYREVRTACCGAGRFNGNSGCTPNATYCSNRRQYLFWDLLHPTHTTSRLAALAIFNGSQQFAAPINFRQLIEDSN
ncbi:GDSL esterase/lipase [Ananas comosus]|uniref:GDSL esterase/lipase n=1 Tax=Ananas comosus TaxID=4615 RepID=A0A199W5L5_ANACO|nr:GDSL esterase/lipase [Ananas comosus]